MDEDPSSSCSEASDQRWTREACRHPVLAAAEIYFMACPSERVPWRDLLLSPSRGPEDLFARPPPPEGWARRRSRRRGGAPPWRDEADGSSSAAVLKAARQQQQEAVAGKKDKVPGRMDSPTTPLSWTTAAASSGSGSGSGGCMGAREDDGVTTAVKRPRRSDVEPNSRLAPVPRTKASSTAPHGGVERTPAPAGVTGRSGTGGLVDATVAAGPRTEAAGPTAPPAAGGGGYTSVSKTTRLLLGKKMTLMELKSYEQSLLQENTEMRKELQRQRMALNLLVQDNTRLKLIKSKHQPQLARQLFVVAADEEEEPNAGKCCQLLPFDLNMPPTEETMDPGEGGVPLSTTTPRLNNVPPYVCT